MVAAFGAGQMSSDPLLPLLGCQIRWLETADEVGGLFRDGRSDYRFSDSRQPSGFGLTENLLGHRWRRRAGLGCRCGRDLI